MEPSLSSGPFGGSACPGSTQDPNLLCWEGVEHYVGVVLTCVGTFRARLGLFLPAVDAPKLLPTHCATGQGIYQSRKAFASCSCCALLCCLGVVLMLLLLLLCTADLNMFQGLRGP